MTRVPGSVVTSGGAAYRRAAYRHRAAVEQGVAAGLGHGPRPERVRGREDPRRPNALVGGRATAASTASAWAP